MRQYQSIVKLSNYLLSFYINTYPYMYKQIYIYIYITIYINLFLFINLNTYPYLQMHLSINHRATYLSIYNASIYICRHIVSINISRYLSIYISRCVESFWFGQSLQGLLIQFIFCGLLSHHTQCQTFVASSCYLIIPTAKTLQPAAISSSYSAETKQLAAVISSYLVPKL